MRCDLSQYVATSKALWTVWSMHVRFIYDEQVFKIVTRFDSQPALASAITPLKATITVNPFVTLAARA